MLIVVWDIDEWGVVALGREGEEESVKEMRYFIHHLRSRKLM
jgi:hypothetical protein